MSIGTKIRAMREQARLSQAELAKILGVSDKAVSTWENDIKTPRMGTLQLLADYFGVTKSFFIENDIDENLISPLNTRDKRDIAKDIAALRESLEHGEGLMFDGDPMSQEAKDSILAAMELGLQAAKLKNKEKYTPKKYKKD